MPDLLPDDAAPPAEISAPPSATPPSGYVVVARRYRPQTFDELIGQEHVATALKGAIQTNRVGHAYLFTGARGVGKTSAARILAKALDCVQGPTPTPCKECDICLSISSGQDVDVLEIDGASNRGIDEIRQLRQNVAVRPSRARYKIYIIDEVHMLTKEAFNALLKTLEEPPEHVKFIFCTTEAERIPITVLSRCQRYDFAGIETQSIVKRLASIAAQEKISVEHDALEVLARRAAGSMRDSQSLLEQLLSLGKTNIGVADVNALLGTANDARLKQIVAALVQRNAGAALKELDAALAEGVDVGQMADQLLGYLRDCMAAAVGCPSDAMLYTMPPDFADVRSFADQWGLETILAVSQILDQALSRMRYSSHGRALLELALVRVSLLENLDDLRALIDRVQSNGPAAPPGSGAPKARAAALPAPASASVTQVSPPTEKKKPDLNGAAPEGESETAPPDSATLFPEQARALWEAALERVEGLLRDHALRATDVTATGPGRLLVTFQDSFHKSYCERPDATRNLEAALHTEAGQPFRLQFKMSEATASPAASAPQRVVSQRERVRVTSQHPLVRRAIELFDVSDIRVEEPAERR